MDDLFKSSNPCDVNNTHNIQVSGWADSQPSVHVYAGAFYTFDYADAACACTVHALSVSAVYSIYIYVFALTVNSTCLLHATSYTAVGKITAPSRPACVNQLWVKPRKRLKEQSPSVNVTVLHLFWQFVSQGNDEALIGLARELHRMLTVLACAYAWVSERVIKSALCVRMWVCICVSVHVAMVTWV